MEKFLNRYTKLLLMVVLISGLFTDTAYDRIARCCMMTAFIIFLVIATIKIFYHTISIIRFESHGRDIRHIKISTLILAIIGLALVALSFTIVIFIIGGFTE